MCRQAVRVERESLDTAHAVAFPDPHALLTQQVNTSRSGRYRITKLALTDPTAAVALIRVRFEPLSPRTAT